MNLSDSKKKLALAGAVCGIVAAALAYFGNPANMAFCIACFIRDTAGALGLHSTETVQYARPEIIGLVLGAFLISAATKEYRSTAGSSPMARFVLGMILAIGSLVFLGCPLRMIIRMSAGDLNAWVALIGFVLGVGTGVFALKKGFSLGRAHLAGRMSGAVLPVLLLGVLILSLATTLLKASQSGPGSMHAPVLLSLAGGLVFGAFAQKSRMCFAGSIRDVILMRNFDLLTIIGSFFVIMLVYNIASGNFVGSSDSAVTVLGMLIGAALAHNLGLAASATAVNAETQEIVSGSVPLNGKIAVVICIAVCFIIGFGNKRTEGR